MNAAQPGIETCLKQKWLASYNKFLYQLIALRYLSRREAPLGLLREQIRDNAIELTDLASYLDSHGFRVSERCGEAEQELWKQTFSLVHSLPQTIMPYDLPYEVLWEDYKQMAESWDRFQRFVVQELPEDFFDHLLALKPAFHREDGLKWLTGERRAPVPTGRGSVNTPADGVQPSHIR